MRLRLYENYRFVLYAPFYAAHAIGAYAAEGLTVELLPSPGAGLAEQALLDGVVDVLWAGPMRVMKHHDENPGSALVCFAEVVCRDPFSIVGRYPNPGFRLADLAQMRIATVSEVPTPWLCLQEDLRQAGIDPARLDRITDRSMAENLNALSEGRIEAAQFFEPVVEEALASGKGHLWYAASARGRTSYTAFVTTRERLVRDAEPLLRMVRAIQRTQQWIYTRSAQEIAAAISSFFPALDIARAGCRPRPLPVAVRMGTRSWSFPRTALIVCGDPSYPQGSSVRPTPYTACVDNRFALQRLCPNSFAHGLGACTDR